MGVYLYLSILPGRITAEAWHSVYRETLTLLEKYPFLDQVERGGHWYAHRAEHREDLFPDGCGGWRTIGDMVTGGRTEDFMLADDISHYDKGVADNGRDILLYGLQELVTDSPTGVSLIWGNKTQGQDSHIYLLAIACLICHRFPNAAMVDGDISAGQCRRAVEWANQFLENPIDVPVTADMTRLLPRLRQAGVEPDKLLPAFFMLTLEVKDPDMGAYLFFQCGASVIEDYFRSVLQIEPNQDGEVTLAVSELKEYLQMGLDFGALCRMVLTGPEGQRLTVESFLKKLLGMKLHVLDKVTYDYTLSPRDKGFWDGVDTVEMQMQRVFTQMGGGRNRNVDAFLPLDAICDRIQSVIGGGCDVGAMAKQALSQIPAPAKDSPQSILYDDPDSDYQQYCRALHAEASYDIESYDDLMRYRPGSSVKPALEEFIVRSLRTMAGFADQCMDEFCALDREGRERWFLERYKVLVTVEIQERIFSHIMDNEYIRRYMAVYATDNGSDNVGKLLRALLWVPELLEHYWELAET